MNGRSIVVLTCLFLVAGAYSVKHAPAPTSADSGAPQVVQIGVMSMARATHQATLLETGLILISGGCGGRGCTPIHATAELYDVDTQTFHTTSPMVTPRAGHDATLLSDGRVLVTGGWTGQEATRSAELFDPISETWSRADDMNEGRASHVAVSLPDGRVLIMGGGGGGLGDHDSAEIYDPESDLFTSIGSMRSNHYLATALTDGRVLMTGGQNAEGEIVPWAEIFDPATGEFLPTGDMAVARVKHGAATLPDGRVLVIGGSDERSYSGRFTSTEMYDPATGVFSPGPEMQWPRHKIRDAVIALPSGAVLVAGGAARPELFDPADEVFLPADGELTGPQMFATATALPGGDVLILGGYDDQTISTGVAWLVRTVGGSVSNENDELPGFHLLRAFPNPFREHVTIKVEFMQPVDTGILTAVIHNISGQVVRGLRGRDMDNPKSMTFVWDGTDSSGRNVSAGTYFFVLTTADSRRQMPLSKSY